VAAAEAAGARVLRHAVNRGYGSALKTGILAARHEVIVMTDADGTYPSDQIPTLLDELDQADMAVGARIGSHVRIPLSRRPAKWILGWLANRIAGRRIPDLNSGLRAFRRDWARQYFAVLSNRFSFTTTITLAYLADDYRVVYHPINYFARIGKSKIRPRHFMEFCILVLRTAMLFQPLRVFLPLALGFALLGIGKAGSDIVAFALRTPSPETAMFSQPVLSTSALLFGMLAIQLLFVGLVADGVLRRIAQHGPALLPSRAVLPASAPAVPRPSRLVG
jgi:glycosyltransferase involved in cell wall biosynthesis